MGFLKDYLVKDHSWKSAMDRYPGAYEESQFFDDTERMEKPEDEHRLTYQKEKSVLFAKDGDTMAIADVQRIIDNGSGELRYVHADIRTNEEEYSIPAICMWHEEFEENGGILYRERDERDPGHSGLKRMNIAEFENGKAFHVYALDQDANQRETFNWFSKEGLRESSLQMSGTVVSGTCSEKYIKYDASERQKSSIAFSYGDPEDETAGHFSNMDGQWLMNPVGKALTDISITVMEYDKVGTKTTRTYGADGSFRGGINHGYFPLVRDSEASRSEMEAWKMGFPDFCSSDFKADFVYGTENVRVFIADNSLVAFSCRGSDKEGPVAVALVKNTHHVFVMSPDDNMGRTFTDVLEEAYAKSGTTLTHYPHVGGIASVLCPDTKTELAFLKTVAMNTEKAVAPPKTLEDFKEIAEIGTKMSSAIRDYAKDNNLDIKGLDGQQLTDGTVSV